ncbi:alpha/beta hydrolase [Rhodobaculum claviforme]|uniref:Alpha/beta hydrolase n=1 Tax=Rhodobaculum claviforme TaxID=1549854 RepID=A0A934TJZ4_9RHOB|nr:alpha/beta hydrolase [Rhodobaculum claviforme]MBK5927545.1 alpha/beta hydrolase [Rhodobaculum claviforme]
MTDDDPDTAYANAPFIADAAGYPPRWAAQAAAFRASLGTGPGGRARSGLPYGPGARQTFDLFLPEAVARGLVVFLHGGYWRAFGPGDWSHLAAGAVARGWAVAMPGYTLAPEARITAITAEIATALTAVMAEVPGVPVVLTGHSAGGHLAARMLCPDAEHRGAVRLARVVPISPLADLRPLRATAMNADFRLDAAEAEAESPALHPAPAVLVHVWVGGDERPAFLWQARTLAQAWHAPLTVETGRHHFDVIDSLARPDGALTAALLDGLG